MGKKKKNAKPTAREEAQAKKVMIGISIAAVVIILGLCTYFSLVS
ncbi:MAG: hypothetical protein PUF62_05860 [Bacteroidales bacterium]|nr:hypothetical protein [Bacteroidales bacterium]